MKSVGGGCLCMHMVKPLELKYDTRMKESCKTDCRFGILVKNCTIVYKKYLQTFHM